MRKLGLDEIKSKSRETLPLFKLGEKWDIIAALYLASSAGKYVNGITLVESPTSSTKG
ncbi:putative 2,4-dienoyl-CoA reductase ((2E)-enoyl-CoA-producing) [Helianthus debilis subsp. tardiflorus]